MRYVLFCFLIKHSLVFWAVLYNMLSVKQGILYISSNPNKLKQPNLRNLK